MILYGDPQNLPGTPKVASMGVRGLLNKKKQGKTLNSTSESNKTEFGPVSQTEQKYKFHKFAQLKWVSRY